MRNKTFQLSVACFMLLSSCGVAEGGSPEKVVGGYFDKVLLVTKPMNDMMFNKKSEAESASEALDEMQKFTKENDAKFQKIISELVDYYCKGEAELSPEDRKDVLSQIKEKCSTKHFIVAYEIISFGILKDGKSAIVRVNLQGGNKGYISEEVMLLRKINDNWKIDYDANYKDINAAVAELGQNTQSSENQADGEDESFEAFMDKFIADKNFQLQRVAFPVGGVDEGDGVIDWTKENWTHVSRKVTDFAPDAKIEKTETMVKQSYDTDGGASGGVYTFTKKEGKWYMTERNTYNF